MYYELEKVAYSGNDKPNAEWILEQLKLNKFPVTSHGNFLLNTKDICNDALANDALANDATKLFKLLLLPCGSVSIFNDAMDMAEVGCLTATEVIEIYINDAWRFYNHEPHMHFENYLETMSEPVFNKLCKFMIPNQHSTWHLYQKIKKLEERLVILEGGGII